MHIGKHKKRCRHLEAFTANDFLYVYKCLLELFLDNSDNIEISPCQKGEINLF